MCIGNKDVLVFRIVNVNLIIEYIRFKFFTLELNWIFCHRIRSYFKSVKWHINRNIINIQVICTVDTCICRTNYEHKFVLAFLQFRYTCIQWSCRHTSPLFILCRCIIKSYHFYRRHWVNSFDIYIRRCRWIIYIRFKYSVTVNSVIFIRGTSFNC